MRGTAAKRIRALCRLTSGPTKYLTKGKTITNVGYKKVIKETKKALMAKKTAPQERSEKNRVKREHKIWLPFKGFITLVHKGK